MTSSVHVHALCGDDKEVIVRVDGDTPEEYIVANGDEQLLYVFDEKEVSVREREIGTDQSYETPNIGTAGIDMSNEWCLQWRMGLIVRHAAESLVSLETAAEEFRRAEAVLTKTKE